MLFSAFGIQKLVFEPFAHREIVELETGVGYCNSYDKYTDVKKNLCAYRSVGMVVQPAYLHINQWVMGDIKWI